MVPETFAYKLHAFFKMRTRLLENLDLEIHRFLETWFIHSNWLFVFMSKLRIMWFKRFQWKSTFRENPAFIRLKRCFWINQQQSGGILITWSASEKPLEIIKLSSSYETKMYKCYKTKEKSAENDLASDFGWTLSHISMGWEWGVRKVPGELSEIISLQLPLHFISYFMSYYQW